MAKGIDYGMGLSNIDHTTGIRYGVISSHAIGTAWYEDAEADYGTPHCPECGTDVVAIGDDKTEYDDADYTNSSSYGCNDYVCHACKMFHDSDRVFSEEALGYSFEDSDYSLSSCLDSDVMVLKSPYYTRAVFCSPCVPGACSLESPDDDGAKAYCLGHEWFEDGTAPYRVFRVVDDVEVLAS